MLTKKEFEQITEIEHILTAPRGTPPQIRLVQEPALIFLSEPVAHLFVATLAGAKPGESKKQFRYEGEMLLANAGATELRIDGCRTALDALQVEAANLPMLLAPHSGPRRFRFTLTGDSPVRISMIPLVLTADSAPVAQCFLRVATLPAPRQDGLSRRYEIPFSEALPFADAELEIYPAVLDFGRVPFWGSVNWQIAAPHAKTVTLVGPGFPGGKFSLTASAEKWTGDTALKDGVYAYYLQINDCRTVDPDAAQKLQIGPEGIFSLKTVCHDQRVLSVRNLSHATAQVRLSSRQEWLQVKPAALSIPPHAAAEVEIALNKTALPLGEFAGELEIAVESRTLAIPFGGELFAERKTASIRGNFENGVLKAGKCFVGKPLEIPFTFRTLGNPVIRLFAFDSLSGLMQRLDVEVEEPRRLQEIDCTLRIPTEHLLPHQKTFRLHLETNCYLDNLAGHTFEVECEAVHLQPKPKLLEFAFVKREARHLGIIEVHRSDGGPVDLQWHASDEVKNILKFTRERNNRLRVEATGASLPTAGELSGEIHLEDKNSGAREIMPCYLRLIGLPKIKFQEPETLAAELN